MKEKFNKPSINEFASENLCDYILLNRFQTIPIIKVVSEIENYIYTEGLLIIDKEFRFNSIIC